MVLHHGKYGPVANVENMLGPGNRIVKIDTPSCAELRDLASLHHDFEVARSYLASYLEVPEDGMTAESASEAYWHSAIIRYGRAFGNGVRHAARASTRIYDPGELAAHEFIINIRDKYIAHSVNGWEEAQTWAVLNYATPDARPKITNAGVYHTALGILTHEKAALISHLCDLQLDDLKSRMQTTTERVLDECRQQGGRHLERAAALTEAEFDQSQVSKARPGARVRRDGTAGG